VPLAGGFPAQANVKLEVKIHPDLPLFKFDYQKVQQCMANLLDNALKHTPAGGVSRCAPSRISGSAALPSSTLPKRGAGESAAVPEQHPHFGFRHRSGIAPSIIRRFSRISCAWTHFLGHGFGAGDRQAADPGASREDLGG
jgi:hypothetical protein